MLVRNNTTTPCCGENHFIALNIEVSHNSDYFLVETFCKGCGDGGLAVMNLLELYEVIRKSSILFPESRYENHFSRWPVCGPVERKVYWHRVDEALHFLFDRKWRTEYDPDVVDNSWYVKLAWQTQAHSRPLLGETEGFTRGSIS